jgi:hypothetical protein
VKTRLSALRAWDFEFEDLAERQRTGGVQIRSQLSAGHAFSRPPAGFSPRARVPSRDTLWRSTDFGARATAIERFASS